MRDITGCVGVGEPMAEPSPRLHGVAERVEALMLRSSAAVQGEVARPNISSLPV